MIYIESLRYICILCTKEYKSLFKTEESKKKMREIILQYFEIKEKSEDIKFISVSINDKHVEITFEAPSSIELTKFVSTFKSVSSRRFLKYLKSIKFKVSGIWTKNYLLATQEYQLNQKKESFLQALEYKSLL